MNWEVWQEKKGVQGLQAFAFCAVTVNDEHTYTQPTFQRQIKVVSTLFQRYGSKLK